MSSLIPALISSWAAFSAAHLGQPASTLSVTAQWHAAHGLVLHDGLCAYSETTRLGCYDPMSGPGGARDLSCSEPVVRADGAAWLHLHGEVFAPFESTSAPALEPLPLWAFAHATDPETDALLVWGYTYVAPPEAAGQELWEWQPGTPPVRLARGPAELSGGIAPWPGESGCLALATYAMAEEPCDGETTVWKWCRAAPSTFTAASRFLGCSGRILAATEADGVAIWNVRGGEATIYRAFAPEGEVPRTVAYAPDQLALATDPAGNVQRIVWDGAAVVTASARAESPRAH